jgi:hypothetical protein
MVSAAYRETGYYGLMGVVTPFDVGRYEEQSFAQEWAQLVPSTHVVAPNRIGTRRCAAPSRTSHAGCRGLMAVVRSARGPRNAWALVHLTYRTTGFGEPEACRAWSDGMVAVGVGSGAIDVANASSPNFYARRAVLVDPAPAASQRARRAVPRALRAVVFGACASPFGAG